MNFKNLKFRYYCEESHQMMYSTNCSSLVEFFDDALKYALNNDIMICLYKKDKDNREIYEGDYLGTSNNSSKYDKWSINEYGMTEVIYNKKKKELCFSNWYPIFKEEEDYKKDESVFSQKFISIIGNKYQGIFEIFK